MVLVLRVPDGLLLGQGLGQLLSLLSASCEGALANTTVQSDLGEAERSSATLNQVVEKVLLRRVCGPAAVDANLVDIGLKERPSSLMAAIMVPARGDGGAGLGPRRQPEEVATLSSSSSFAAGASEDLEADLGKEGQRNCQQVLEAVEVKTCCPERGLSAPSGPTRAQFCHSG